MILDVVIGDKKHQAEIKSLNGRTTIVVDGKEYAVDAVRCRDGSYSILLGGKSYEVAVQEGAGGTYNLYQRGKNCTVEVLEHTKKAPGGAVFGAAKEGKGVLLAPMPGRVVKILVREGEEVKEKQGLIVIEAMKMENELASPKTGSVARIRVAKGDRVDPGTELMVIE
jgi:biotin carboxyl carrier protein